MIGTPFFTELWKRVGSVLSPVNSGDSISVDGGATFNTDAGDNDFTIKKQTSGDAFKYDAGLDVHSFNGKVTGNASETSAFGIENADYVLKSTWNNNSASTLYGAVISVVSNANNYVGSKILTLTYAKPTQTEVFSVDTRGVIKLIANNGSGIEWGTGAHIRLASNTLESRGYDGFRWTTNQGDKMRLFQYGSLQLGGTFGGSPSELLQVNGQATINGQSDLVQLTVKGNATQTNNLQEWQDSIGSTVASLSNIGKFTSNHIYIPNEWNWSTPIADNGTYLYHGGGHTFLHHVGGNSIRIQRNGVDLLELNVTWFRVMQEATFNYNFTDDDFIINKNGSGQAYKYDAGNDSHAFDGDMGFFGATPVTQPTALTAEDATVIDATYGTDEENVINNLRTRVGELESKLQALGILA